MCGGSTVQLGRPCSDLHSLLCHPPPGGLRATLIVVGHVESLQTNPRWSALVSHARKGGCMYKAGAGLPPGRMRWGSGVRLGSALLNAVPLAALPCWHMLSAVHHNAHACLLSRVLQPSRLPTG